MKLLFQPAEEGFAGAKEMIKDGCLEAGSLGPRVDYVYGIHIWSCKTLKQVILVHGSLLFFVES